MINALSRVSTGRGSFIFPKKSNLVELNRYWLAKDSLSVVAFPVASEVAKYRCYFIGTANLGIRDIGPEVKKKIVEILNQPDAKEFKVSSDKQSGEVNDDLYNIVNSLAVQSGLSEVVRSNIYQDFSSYFSQYTLHRWVQHPQILSGVKSGNYLGILPVTVELVPTLNCTYRCGKNQTSMGCAYRPQKELYGNWDKNVFDDERVHMRDPRLMGLITDRLAEAGVRAVIVTGGGEPTLSKVTVEGIKKLKSAGLDVGLYTNGSVLTERQIKQLISADIDFIRVSLNAGTENGHRSQHDYLHPNANYFQRVLKNIYLIAKEIIDSQSNTEFGIGMLVSSRNRGELFVSAERMLEAASRAGGGIDFVTYRPEIDYYGGDQIDQEISKEADEAHGKISDLFSETEIKFRWLSRRFEGAKGGKGYKKCLANSIIGEIAPDARLYLCCEKHFMPDYLIGDLKAVSFQENWQSEQRRMVIDRINNEQLSQCPSLCKPHELNKIFNEIEEYRDAGRWSEVEEWIGVQQILPRSRWTNFF